MLQNLFEADTEKHPPCSEAVDLMVLLSII